VEVYYSAELHRELLSTPIGNAEGLEKDVASDVMSSLKLFSEYFGPCPVDRLRVSEILAFHGEAFPGLLHMGIPTWVQTDSEGDQKLFRAHEVAHQWWGVEVGYDSYRDQWLSEAFAEYSALLYVQKSLGTPDMLSALAQYREDIFSVRSYLFGRGERSGSIALGYRASSTRTEGDFDLVVYKKGAYVLHMLRALLMDPATLDDHKFFDLLREFYATYRGQDATTSDFQRLAEKYAGENLDWFFKQWVYGEALPECKLSSKSARMDDGTWSVTGEVVTTGVSDPFRIDMLMEVDFAGARPVYVRRKIGPGKCPVEIDSLPQPPTKVLLNPFGAILARVK
jgi:predicted metalloprotease with PDZ domain